MVKLEVKQTDGATKHIDCLSMRLGQWGIEYYQLETRQQYIIEYDKIESWKASGKVTDAQRTALEAKT